MTSESGNGKTLSSVLKGIQINVVADVAMIVALATLIFWVGRQAERVDIVSKVTEELRADVAEIKGQNERISGQVLQSVSASNMAVVEQRVSVNETRIDAQESFVREMKGDIVQRLARIENKLDSQR